MNKPRNDDEIAEAIKYAARHLGTADAATHMGAIEILAMETKEGSERIASALHAVANAIESVANAIDVAASTLSASE